jgi:lipoprotein NlpD
MIAAGLVTGCSSSSNRAPIVEHDAAATYRAPVVYANDTEQRPSVYVVQRGDTLYSIASRYSIYPNDLAVRNNLQDPNQIQVGQQLYISGASEPVIVENRNEPLKDQPKVVKYTYSEAAVSKAETGRVEVKPLVRVASRPQPATGDDVPIWSLPTQGKVIGTFSEAGNRKGVDIAGSFGQPILASAAGKVVYSGTGLRGYGKLIIIRHNKTFISAYAHNSKLLVKEGQIVKRGQKIAEMGSSESDDGKTKLHFEVRRLGIPVNPASYMNFN